MKIIDLLNKIANGEEVPKEFIYRGIIYYYCGAECGQNIYYTRPRSEGGDWLHFEIADIDDELKITDIGYLTNQLGEDIMKGFKAGIGLDTEIKKLNKDKYVGTDLSIQEDMFNKINELIDKVNKL